MKTVDRTARRILAILLAAFLLSAIPVAADPGAALETLAPDTSRAEIQSSQGVVLLDIYAEW